MQDPPPNFPSNRSKIIRLALAVRFFRVLVMSFRIVVVRTAAGLGLTARRFAARRIRGTRSAACMRLFLVCLHTAGCFLIRLFHDCKDLVKCCRCTRRRQNSGRTESSGFSALRLGMCRIFRTKQNIYHTFPLDPLFGLADLRQLTFSPRPPLFRRAL